jgi:hypothetical protein
MKNQPCNFSAISKAAYVKIPSAPAGLKATSLPFLF